MSQPALGLSDESFEIKTKHKSDLSVTTLYAKEVEKYGVYIIYHSNYYLLNYDRTKKKYL